MALDSLAVPLVQVFESNITNARMILGAMGSADLLRAFRLTQKLEDYIIDIMEQIESVREQASSRGSSVLRTVVSSVAATPFPESGRGDDGPTSPSTTKPRHPAGLKRRGAAGSSRSNVLLQQQQQRPGVTVKSESRKSILWQHPSLRATSSEEDEVTSLPPQGNGDILEDAASPTSTADFILKSEPFPAFPSGSVFPGPCPESPHDEACSPELGEASLAAEATQPEPKRPRQQHNQRQAAHHVATVPPEEVWRVAVCLLPGPDVNRAPSSEQVTEWTLAGQGLPQNQDSVEVDRRWGVEQFADFITNLYPDYPQLQDVGYSFCIADMENSLSELRETESVEELASVVGAGPLYVRPRMILPVANINSGLPSLASTPSKVFTKSLWSGDMTSGGTDSPEKPSECGLCGRTFLRVGDMRRHMREQHTTDRARTKLCHICNRAFKRSFHLNSHMMSMHGLVSSSVIVGGGSCSINGGASGSGSRKRSGTAASAAAAHNVSNSSMDDSIGSVSAAEDSWSQLLPEECAAVPGTGIMEIRGIVEEENDKETD